MVMPLIVKDFSWRQTPTTIYLTVKIKGIRSDKTSFITGDNYIRLHYPPHYFETFLWGEVDEVNGKCKLDEKEGLVVFEMPKLTPGEEWPSLDSKELSRGEKHEKRVRAVTSSQQRAANELEKAMARRQEQRQMSIHEQLRLDDEARARIAAIKTFDTRTALEQLREWQAKEETNPSSPDSSSSDGEDAQYAEENNLSPNKDESDPSCPVLEKEEETFLPVNRDRAAEIKSTSPQPSPSPIAPKQTERTNKWSLAAKKEKTIWEHADHSVSIKEEEEGSGDGGGGWMSGPNSTSRTTTANCMPVRVGGSVAVCFTPREFPTPSRESTAAEEEEWLRKQKEAMRMSGFNDADLRPEERDPTWLLEKGTSLMGSESYLGAVSAFSTGIKLAPKMPELYTARASSHLALSNYRKAVEDASQALEMLTPKVPRNEKERLKTHTCRGHAFHKLGMFPEAVSDLSEALRLDPTNEALQEEVKQAQLNAGAQEDSDGEDGDN